MNNNNNNNHNNTHTKKETQANCLLRLFKSKTIEYQYSFEL